MHKRKKKTEQKKRALLHFFALCDFRNSAMQLCFGDVLEWHTKLMSLQCTIQGCQTGFGPRALNLTYVHYNMLDTLPYAVVSTCCLTIMQWCAWALEKQLKNCF